MSRQGHRILSDAELVHAAWRGDKRAFVEIVARHQPMVCGIALGILGDFAASEDAGQDAFLTAWRKIHELREPQRLRGWLGQIARNAALGHLRQRKEHVLLQDELADQTPTPDQAAASEEEAILVRESLAKLPENYRLPLILYYREGQCGRAAAEALGISEDALKQRLARGREMLREEIAGKIESVLRRSAPSAIFTMTIAAAIGALATPAAMAGVVFTAASGASSTTASGSSILTAISTAKAVFIAAAVVAVISVPVGYQIRAITERPAIKTARKIQPELPPEPGKTAAIFEQSGLFVEWRGLHVRYGTNAQAMPVLYKTIDELKDPFRREAFRAALIAEWAQVDPIEGLRFFLGKPDEVQRRQFFEEWLAKDAAAAVAALMTAGAGWEKIAPQCLKEIARKLPSRVPEIASRLPTPEDHWETDVRDAFAILAEDGLVAAQNAAETVAGPNRSEALAGVAQTWAKTDLKAAIAWAKALPDGIDRDEIIRAALLGKAAIDPAAALELVGTVPGGERMATFASTTGARVLAKAAEADFDATVAWLAAHPGRLGNQDFDGLAQSVTPRLNADAIGFLSQHAADGSLTPLLPAIKSALQNGASGQRSAVWEWLKTQPAGEAQVLREPVLTSAAYQEPELALQFITDVPQGLTGDFEIAEVARCLLNYGSDLNRFDKLLMEAPERLRQPLIDAAFKSLRGENLDDPQKWIERLSRIPEASRSAGIEAIARAWAQQRPEEAIGWATSLPPGKARNGAAAAIVTSWAATDAHSAADWVAAMPAGAERDRSAESLVLAVAAKYPSEAWNWALSITDKGERESAAAYAVKTMAALDPATARQWIETGPFTADKKKELQAAFQSKNSK